MSSIQTTKMTNYRWVICSMLFFATTVNYMDRQVLSLTWKNFIAPEFHWTDADYGMVTGIFSILYAFFCLFAGKFIDKLGTKRGYLTAIGVWSLGACMHAACGWLTMHIVNIPSLEALRAVKAGSELALSISTISVYLFLFCRAVLAMGEAGNFPSAIKVTAEYFPKKDRAFATAIFNSGASIGALAAPITIPVLAEHLGWEMAFIIIGGLGFVWMALWVFVYDRPTDSKHVNKAEMTYINQDQSEDFKKRAAEGTPQKEEKTIPFFKCLRYRQTWSFIVGKLMTDGVWWFYLFWAPAYFSDQFNYGSNTTMGKLLIFVLYLIVTVISVFGGYLPKFFVEKKGMGAYSGRMLAMLIFAFFPLLALFAQPLASWKGSPIDPAWWPAIIIGLAGAGHQAWSANLFSTIGDMFPTSTVATITGIGTMAGGIGSWLINTGSGELFNYAQNAGAAFTFLGFSGKPAGYMIIFCICAVAYLIGWTIMKTLVPKYKPIVVEEE
ncbi:MAG: MFS transporter [Prevotella sp.]|nr:MFS transporter [Prevotella sp.]MCH3994447.1 MFS transporter [Prevotella sp.]